MSGGCARAISDIIANAGGVVSSYSECAGQDPPAMFQMVEEKIVRKMRVLLEKAEEEPISPREAALGIAQRRVREAMNRRQPRAA